MSNESRISADAIITNLTHLKITNAAENTTVNAHSGTTSATTSFPPSTALSLNSYDTPETSDDEDHDGDLGISPPFNACQTKDRGLALFTTRRIRPGTLIFCESPVVSLPKQLEDYYDAVEAACRSLDRSYRKMYLALYDAEKSRMSRVVSIYYSNCYNKDGFTPEGGSCISPLASRVNHSCVPNATFSYLPPSPGLPKGQVRFHAIKNIPANKEIVSCYEKNIFLTREQRLNTLVLDYGFKCDCEACVPKSEFWEKSDERRKAMAECVRVSKRCEKEWNEVRNGSERDTGNRQLCEQAIENLVKLEKLFVKEGLASTPLANASRSLAKWSERMGDDSGARNWKQKELAVCRVCFGEDAVRSKSLLQNLEVKAPEEMKVLKG